MLQNGESVKESTRPADPAWSYASEQECYQLVRVLKNGENVKDSAWPADPAWSYSSEQEYYHLVRALQNGECVKDSTQCPSCITERCC